ncbi:MAG: hypothetical protein H0U92_14350 [Actinobacteria bacterium]|nr:hypothetical protein [Actinomycetota bacterium]
MRRGLWNAMFVLTLVLVALTTVGLALATILGHHYGVLWTGPLWAIAFWWLAIGARQRAQQSNDRAVGQ